MLKQTKEEIANTLTHLAGIGVAFGAGGLLIAKGMTSSRQSLLGVIIFSVGMLLMYSASTIYHWTLPGKWKQTLRYLDHINIYVLIAASYTPILLCSIGGVLGWSVFAAMWGMALIGAFYKIFFLGKYPRLSLAIYLTMGWSVVFIAKSVWQNMPTIALWCILIEGISYTIGTYFYSRDTSTPYYHAVWHLFVLGGTASHIAAVWFII
ncbi:MAG: hemolysin III family protein [Bacteroidales bacterium]